MLDVPRMQRQINFFFALEIEIHGALSEPGGLGHIGDVSEIMALGEQPFSSIEDRLTTRLFVFAIERTNAFATVG